MKKVNYGLVKLKLKEIMDRDGISITELACKAEMQRTQLKAYINGTVQRVDLGVLARLCHALECDVSDILVYEKKRGRPKSR